MPMNAPPIKARLKEGPLLGAFLFTSSPDVAEIMAIAGYDALVVDREHVAADLEGALHQLRAIRAVSEIPVLVRVRDHAESSIKPLLDAGFDGILAANVRSAAEARAIVHAGHYAPLGRRGAHYTVSRAAGYGVDRASYVEHARRETLIVAMIESGAGWSAIEDIAAVDGIDMLFLGPLDLTADFGKFGDLADPQLAEALRDAEARILASGVWLGGALLPSMPVADAFRRGYRFVTGASDVGLLLASATASVASARSVLG